MTNSSKQPAIPVAFILVILLGLINGALYIFNAPPWQHYDEPNHFEYAWWLANYGRKPKPTDVDTEMRRSVARSMIENHVFDQLSFLPDLTAEGKNIWIGQYSQVNDPPLYYAIISLPLRLFANEYIETQLYVGRGVSLLFFLLTIVAAYGFARETTPPGHPIRFLLPFTIAVLPGFADLMTAVNNDVGLVLWSSWFLWGAVRLIMRGFNLLDFTWAVLAAVLAIFTKQTGILLLPVFAVAVMFSILRGRYRIFAWVILGGLAIIGGAAIINWNQPALWYVRMTQTDPVRFKQTQTPLGDYDFRVEATPYASTTSMIQILPLDASSNLAGKKVTLGAWLWSDRPIDVEGPALNFSHNNRRFVEKFSISTVPEFYSFSAKLPYNLQRAWLSFEPASQPQQPSSVFIDGITLVEGDYSQAGPPIFQDRFGQEGVWGGDPFENLVRNASAERMWIGLQPWFDRLGPRIYPDYGLEGLSLALYTVRDRSAAGWFYWNSIVQLGRTFWGQFGWGNIPLAGDKPYRPLAALTGLGIAGALAAMIRMRRKVNWAIIFWLGMAVVLVWVVTLFRGSIFILGRAHFLPVARYVFPVILPMMLILVSGWHEVLRVIERKSKHLWPWMMGAYVGLFLGIDLYALFSLNRFFAG